MVTAVYYFAYVVKEDGNVHSTTSHYCAHGIGMVRAVQSTAGVRLFRRGVRGNGFVAVQARVTITTLPYHPGHWSYFCSFDPVDESSDLLGEVHFHLDLTAPACHRVIIDGFHILWEPEIIPSTCVTLRQGKAATQTEQQDEHAENGETFLDQ